MTEAEPWYNGRQVLFDLETGGLNPDEDDIVTGTVIEVIPRPLGGGSRPTLAFEWLAVPTKDIPQLATDVHGITTEYAREHGEPMAEVVEEMTSALAELMLSGATLIGMNVQFDLTFLDRKCHEYGVVPLDARLPNGIRPVVDVYVIDKGVHPYRKGKRNLGALCEFYKVSLDGAHNATADALAAGRVAWALCRDYPEEVRNVDVQALHDRQVAWKVEQSRSFATFLRREAGKIDDPVERQKKLDDADGVRPEWPFIPRPVPDATLC